jgi:pimeloyl-ACP methyl ester carboxylesterase
MIDFKSQFAEVNNIRLHYISKGQGKLILFVHGFPEYWGAWENQLLEFGKRFHAVALDMRGYNLSSRPEDPNEYHVKYLMEDIRSLAEHLGYHTFSLVAHDWGGAVAWSFASTYPEYLEKLIIINSPHPALFARELMNNPDQRKASEYMHVFRSAEAEQIFSENRYEQLLNVLFKWGNSRWKPTTSIKNKYREAWSKRGALTGGLNYYRVSPLYPPESKEDEERIRGIMNLPENMFKVKTPTLVLWGEEDSALLLGNLAGLDDYVENLTVKRIPDASHWVVHEKPDVVNALIRDFI